MVIDITITIRTEGPAGMKFYAELPHTSVPVTHNRAMANLWMRYLWAVLDSSNIPLFSKDHQGGWRNEICGVAVSPCLSSARADGNSRINIIICYFRALRNFAFLLHRMH